MLGFYIFLGACLLCIIYVAVAANDLTVVGGDH